MQLKRGLLRMTPLRVRNTGANFCTCGEMQIFVGEINLSFSRLDMITGKISIEHKFHSLFKKGVLFWSILITSFSLSAQDSTKFESYIEAIEDMGIYNDSVFIYIDSIKSIEGEIYWNGRYVQAYAFSVRNDTKDSAKVEIDICIEHYKSINDTINLLKCLRLADYIEQDLNDYRAAIKRLNLAANLAIASKDSLETTYFEGELGYLFMDVLQDMERAFYHLQRSHDIALQIRDWQNANRSSCYLMEYWVLQGDTVKSGEYAEKAFYYSTKLDSTEPAYYDGYLTMGYYLLDIGKYEEATEYGHIIAAKGREFEDYDMLTNGSLVLAEAFFESKQLNKAYNASSEAVMISERLGDITGLEPSYDIHWRICEALGKKDEALSALKKYNEYHTPLTGKEELATMARELYKGDLEREKMEKEKVELTLDVAEQKSRFTSLMLVSLLGLFLALGIYSYIIYKRNKREKEYNRTLEASNEVILSQKQSLEMTLDEVKKDLKEKEKEADAYYFAQSAIQIKFSNIIALEASNNYVLIHVEERANPLLERVKLKELIEHFPSNMFVRIHRSYCINVDHIISRPSKYVVKMSNDMVLNVSRSYVDELGDKFLKQGLV